MIIRSFALGGSLDPEHQEMPSCTVGYVEAHCEEATV